MNTKILPQSNSLTSGSTLWVLPQPDVSRWSVKMDWYMGGLITNAEQRKPQTISSSLSKILIDEDITLPINHTNKNAPLLIMSEFLLPNKKTLILDYNGSVKDWTTALVKVWSQLKSPTIRVFLPSTVKAAHFLEQLPDMKFEEHEDALHMTVVDDKPEMI